MKIFDLVGIAVVVDTVRDCYAALGAIHTLYRPVPGRFKDYIAMPKFNMYQSLHTTVIGSAGRPMEIQIRTEKMHKAAEFGIAAHWLYKEQARGKVPEEEIAWLQRVMDWQRESADPKEFIESLKIDLYSDEVFIFTPKGDVVALPRGATPIDFAYSIHTEVGHRTVGSRVNGRLVSLNHELASGDTVEVITSKGSSGPSRDWLHIAKTPRARNKIRQWFARERREDALAQGRDTLQQSMRKQGLPVRQDLEGRHPPADLRRAEVHGPGFDARSDRRRSSVHPVGDHQSLEAVRTRARRGSHPRGTKAPAVAQTPGQRSHRGRARRSPRAGWRSAAPRCRAIRFVGFLTRGRGVSVHRNDCPNARALQVEARAG